MAFTPSKIGQMVVPLSPRAVAGLDGQQIATEIAPLIIEEARKIGACPVGAPELLRDEEVRGRTADPLILANLDLHPGSLWLLVELVPLAEAAQAVRARRPAAEATEIVVPPVRLPRGRRGRG